MLWARSDIHRTWSVARWVAMLPAPILALVLSCGACGAKAELTPLSPNDISDNGVLVLEATRETVLDACVLALRKQGYEIDAVEPETGLIVTLRRAERSSPPGGRHFRLYVVEVKGMPTSQVQVSAWPAVTEADMARGNRPYTAPLWDLDEERAAWTRLFEDVRAIVERASP